MSDFLVRLTRRAVGLAPIAVPRPADIPTDMLMPVQGAADRPAVLPEVMAATPGDGPFGLPAAPPPVSEAPGELSTATTCTRRIEVPAPLLRTQSPRPAPPEVAARAASPSGADAPPLPEPVAVVERNPMPLPTRPSESIVRGSNPEPPPLAQVKPDVAHAAEPVVAAPIPRASDHGAEAAHVPQGFPVVAVVAAKPAPAALAWPAGKRAEAEEPSIQVHIGRIELVPQPPSPPLSPVPRREPRGFREQWPARRYLDRRWY